MSSILSSSIVSCIFNRDAVNEALDNELILNMIFYNFQDLCDLIACRLVCSKWNRLSVKHIGKNNWRNRIYLNFGSDEILEDFINTFSGSQNSLMFSCFSFYGLGRLNPVLLKSLFKTVPLKLKILHLYHRLKSLEQLEYILQSQATSLIELTIRTEIENFLSKFSMETKSDGKFYLSNLTYLSLLEAAGFQHHEQKIQNQFHIELLGWLLSKIPTTTVKNIATNSRPLRIYIKDCKTLTPTINLLKKFGHIKHLKMFDLSSFKPGELNILTDAGVELKFLSLHPSKSYGEDGHGDHHGPMITNEIYQFLQSQINSLQVLEYKAQVFKFPSVMNTLKTLQLIYGPNSAVDNAQIPVFYHQYFPNLQVL